jgi:hypothetical protein
MNYELRQFVANTAGGVSTVTLRAPGSRDMTFYQDSGDQIRDPLILLFSGVKYNTNGTFPSVEVPGQVQAIFLCRGDNQDGANNQAETLTAINGRSGTLYGIEYTASGVATHTCSALAQARVISRIDQVGASVGRAHSVEVELTFDRLNKWS